MVEHKQKDASACLLATAHRKAHGMIIIFTTALVEIRILFSNITDINQIFYSVRL